ncbi:MAG: hypothetical protein EXS16_01755 [Gemmataceae bacterium]|nr:hypothetical protein [Gemmataceae bacterium]
MSRLFVNRRGNERLYKKKNLYHYASRPKQRPYHLAAVEVDGAVLAVADFDAGNLLYRDRSLIAIINYPRRFIIMATTITRGVTNGVVIPVSPNPKGDPFEAGAVSSVNPLLQFSGHLDPNDPIEQKFIAELARRRGEDLDQMLREDEECHISSSTPTT